jgi:hypothetical protein
MTVTATPISVTAWGELPAERKLPGALRVLVAGQAAGGAERRGDVWIACWYAGLGRSGQLRNRVTEHTSAEEAVRAVIRSVRARRLGARAASPVSWSARTTRLAGRGSGRPKVS